MGRFETTVEFYRYREPYPAAFFEEVAERLALTPETRLLDVGCGPANLTIGFAPFVGACTAIDIEPEMLRVAREHASRAGVNIRFIETSIEDLDAPANSFDFITAGRSLHWLRKQETLNVLESVVAPGGSIATCGSKATDTATNDWVAAYRKMRDAWSPGHNESFYKVDLEQWFAPSRFRKVEDICVPYTHRVTIDDLIARALSFSTSSPAVLGERRPQFEAEMRAALEPFAHDSELEEALAVKATVFR